MTALAVDASGPWISLALEHGGELFERNIQAPARQNEILMHAIDELCTCIAVTPKDLDFVACTGGPGSFTGLRITLSIVKGIALARGIPLFTENTLLCQADAASATVAESGADGASAISGADGASAIRGADGASAIRGTDGATDTSIDNSPILSVQDARKGSFFTLFIQGKQELVERGIYTRSQLYEICADWPRIRVCGVGTELFNTGNPADSSKYLVIPPFERGFAKELLQRAHLRYTIEPQGDSLDCGLDYMKKSEAEESLETRMAQAAP